MSDIIEENNLMEIDSTSAHTDTENIIAHILIEQNPEMDATSTLFPVTTVASTVTEQSHSDPLDANSAYSMLEKAIAQSMAEQGSAVMDDGSTYVTVETTIVPCEMEQNVSEHLTTDSAHSIHEKTSEQSLTEQGPTEMDTTSTPIPEKNTVEQNVTEKNDSEKLDTNSAPPLLEKTVAENAIEIQKSDNSFKRPVGNISAKRGFFCNICGIVFTLKDSLPKHMARYHGAERMRYFLCHYCSRTFKIRRNMTRHLLIIHGVSVPDRGSAQEIFLNEAAENDVEADTNEWVCKAKNCIRRKNDVSEQAMQTGCDCVPPKERCLFCRKDLPVLLPENDDSECICFENFFEPEKTFADVATETGCGRVDCNECELCPKFDAWVNSAGVGIQCLECNISFVRTNQLRNHLNVVHKTMVDYETHDFPDMNAFKKWKNDIERKEVTKYIRRHGVKRTVRGLKYFYDCHRSGKYAARIPKREKMVKKGSFKLGIICTSSMYCEHHSEGVTVKYWPQHYGHGKETSFVQISPEEQIAIQESVSSGISVENILDDIRDHQSSSDQSQLFLMKKRDIRFISNCFNAVEYNSGVSDAESVDQWVRTCCQMEESPILFYRQEFVNSGEEFLLIIMTEFQKQILLSSDHQVVYVDSFFRQRGARFYLTVLFVMDECEIAFPVAFCISDKNNKEVMVQFFTSIQESTGSLNPPYFMSDNQKFYHEAWLEVMGADSKWLWCLWYVDDRVKLQLRHFKSAKRVEVYNTMQVLMECQNETVFQSIYKNFIDSLSDPMSQSMGAIVQKLAVDAEKWAYCYRKEVKAGTNIRLEAMHYTFRYCCREGRKKRLDKFIFVIMKLVRRKMLDRLTNVLDEENIDLAVKAINMFHEMGLEISTENISSLSDKIWLIHSEEEGDVYVTCDLETCPEDCKLKCAECDICVHMYSCSCVNSMINANLCQHIHAIAWKFLTPHFSPSASPVPDNCDEEMEDGAYSTDKPVSASELLDNVLKRAHDVYKRVKANKADLKKDTLTNIMKRLNECVDLISGKTIQEEPQNQVYVLASYDEGDAQSIFPSVPSSLPMNSVLQSLPINSLQQPVLQNLPINSLQQPVLQNLPTTSLKKPVQQNVPTRSVRGNLNRNSALKNVPIILKNNSVPQTVSTTKSNPKTPALISEPSTLYENTETQYFVLVEGNETI